MCGGVSDQVGLADDCPSEGPEGDLACRMVGDSGKMEGGSGRLVDMIHFEGEGGDKVASVIEEIPRPEGASASEDFERRSVSYSEAVSKNGAVAGNMLDPSCPCTMQPAITAIANDAEDFGCVDREDLNETSGLIDMNGNVSAWESNVLNEDPDVTKNECASDFVASGSQSQYGFTGEGLVRRYTRAVLEALRFVDVDKQRQKWNKIYNGLETFVSREYDEISANGQKKLSRNHDQRQQQEKNKGTFTYALLGENIAKVSDALETSGLLYGSSVDEESWAAEDESCNEDDSDDEYDSIQRPAFLVEGEPDFESGPPQDGLEYLKRVRWEAAQMPKVKFARFDRSKWSSEQTPYMPKIPEIAKCPENLSPLKHWVDIFLDDFSDLRKAFSEFENSENRALGPPTDEDLCKDSLGLQMRKNIPTVSAILGMDPISRAALLRNRIKAFESASTLSRDDCLWMFALCAVVDIPFNAEMSSCLRCLLRKCSSLLANKSGFDEEVAMLNILVAISGKYFGQSGS